MPIEILELIVRARVQQEGPDTATSRPAETNAESASNAVAPATAPPSPTIAGAPLPTVEEVVSQILKRKVER